MGLTPTRGIRLALMALALASVWALMAPGAAAAGTCTGVTATRLAAGTPAPHGSPLSAPPTGWGQVFRQCSPAASTGRGNAPHRPTRCGGANHRQIAGRGAH